MSEISETEIKSMSKEQNYMHGYEDGKSDVLDKIRAEIKDLTYYWCEVNPKTVIDDVLEIIDKYKAESEDKE
jgi:hypothetical protein